MGQVRVAKRSPTIAATRERHQAAADGAPVKPILHVERIALHESPEWSDSLHTPRVYVGRFAPGARSLRSRPRIAVDASGPCFPMVLRALPTRAKRKMRLRHAACLDPLHSLHAPGNFASPTHRTQRASSKSQGSQSVTPKRPPSPVGAISHRRLVWHGIAATSRHVRRGGLLACSELAGESRSTEPVNPEPPTPWSEFETPEVMS